MFFAETSQLWFVKINVDGLLHHRIEWGSTGCVSLYGQFGTADVESVHKCERTGSDTWADRLQREDWLQ